MSEVIRPPKVITAENVQAANAVAEKKLEGVSRIAREGGASGVQDQTIVKSGYNYDPMETNRDLAYQKAYDSQSTGDIFKNAVIGMGKQAVAGAILNFAGNDPTSLINMAIGNTTADYENSLHKLGLGMLKDAQEENPILQNPNSNSIFSGAYLGQQVQGLGLTIGIMAEGFGEQALFSALTAASGGATGELQAVELAKTLSNINKLNTVKQFAFGAFQGLKEAHMNSVFTGQETREKYKSLGYSEEEATKIGNETATRAFRIETLPLMVMNSLQWGALGHFNPWGSASKEFMGASGAFESLSSKLAPSLGKRGSKIAERVIQSGSEAFEEAWQDIPQGYSQFKTDTEQGKVEKNTDGTTKTLSDYLFNQGMRDDAIGGAFGGLIFGVLGGMTTKGLAKFGARKLDANVAKAYDSLLKASTERSIDNLASLKSAIDSGDEHAANMAREKVNRDQAIDALRWDKLKGSEDTNMFNARLENMNTLLKAVEDKDEDTLKRYKIDTQEDKDFILNNYPTFVQQALDLKEELAKNVANSVDYDSGEKLTELNAIKKANNKELIRSQQRITEVSQREDFQALSPELKSYALINAELQSLQGEIGRTEEQKQRRTELEASLTALKSDKFDPTNLTQTQKNFLESTQEVEQLKSLFESKATIEKNLESNVNEVAKYNTPQKQVIAKQENFKKKVDTISSINKIEALDSMEREAKGLGLLNTEVKNSIETRRAELNAKKKVMKNVKVENSKTTQQTDTDTLTETSEQKQARLSQQIKDARQKKAKDVVTKNPPLPIDNTQDDDLLKSMVTPPVDSTEDNSDVIKTEDLFGMAKPLFATDTTRKQQFKNSVAKIKSAYEVAGKKLGIRDLLSYYIGKNMEGAEKSFNYIIDAYKENGGEVTENLDSLYRDLFEIDDDTLLSEMANIEEEVLEDKKGIETTQKTVTPEKAEISVAQSEKIVAEEEAPYEDTEDPKKSIDDIETDQIADATPKIPFLGVTYTPVYNELTGKYEFVTTGKDLNREGKTLLDRILNFKVFNKGTKFNIRVSPNWQEAEVQIWEEDEKGHLSPRVSTMSEWMKSKNIPLDENLWTPEQRELWTGKVPMEMWYKGEVIGMGTHDVEWWNTRNVASFTRDGKLSKGEAIARQQRVISQGRENAMRIRKNVLEGNDEMIITNRYSGHSSTIDRTEPRRILSEENPTAMVAYVAKGEVWTKYNGKNGKVKISSSQIINFDTIDSNSEGLAHILTEIDVNEKGEPQYVLNQVVSNERNFQSSLDTIGKFERLNNSLVTIEKYVRLLRDKQNGRVVNEVEYQKALKLKADIQKLTNINIADISGNTLTGYNKLKDLFPRELRQKINGVVDEGKKSGVKTEPLLNEGGKPSLSILIQGYGFEKNGFPIVTTNTDGTVSVTNYKSQSGEEGYSGMLKDHLTTQKKFYKISDEKGEDKYIAYAQPILQFDLSDSEKDVTRKEEVQEEKKKVEEVKTEEIQEGKKLETVAEETKETPTIKEPIVAITHGQRQRVVKYLVNKIVSSLGSNEVKYGDIVKELSRAYDKYLSELKDNPETIEEYNYLMDNKDSIVGLGKFNNVRNTVKEHIENILGEKIKDTDLEESESEISGTIDETTQIVKGLDEASYSYNVKNSLSARLKRLLSGIERVEKKTTLDDFAGLPEYYESDIIFDTMQRLLSDTPNTIKDLEARIESKLKHNSKEFEFLKQVLDKVKSADTQLQKEFLFKLNQTKNDMFFVMVKDDKGAYSLSVLNANAKEPIRKLQNDFENNFKLSTLINKVEDGYLINKEEATKVDNLFEEWITRNAGKDFSNIPNEEVRRWLTSFGIVVSEKTIQDLRNKESNGNRTWQSLFEKKGLFYTLNSNLKVAVNTTKSKLAFDKKSKENVLLNGNGGYLKDLATIEVNNIVVTGTVMRIAGKNVMPFSQPNFTSEQVRKIKEEGSTLLKQLGEASFSKHSLLVKLLNSNEKVKKIFNVSYIGLQSIKQQGSKNRDDLGVTDLSASDYDVLLQGFMTSQGNGVGDTAEGIELITTKMAFPPLSDSSQMFLMDTVKMNLKSGNFTFNEDGTISLDDNILEVLFNQLVMPDLQRITDYLTAKKLGQADNINIEFQEIGSQIFTIIPRLNTLDIDGVELLQLVKAGVNEANKVVVDNFDAPESIISQEIKETIKKALQEVVMDNVNSKFNVTSEGTIQGTWLEEGLVELDEKKGLVPGPLDREYLKSRGPEGMSVSTQIKIAALDYVINNLVHQSQIQMIFAGDLNNYTKDKDKFFEKANALTKEEREAYYINYMKESSVNLFKRLKEQLSPGNRLADSKNKTYSQIIINDKESSSNSLLQLTKLWHPELYDKYKGDLVRFKELENKIDEEKEGIESDSKRATLDSLQADYNSLKKTLKKALPSIADYFDITTTDGQEFTTWKEHLDCLYYQGKISEKEYKSAETKLKDQSENGVNENNKLSEEEKHVIFQPMKPLHAGMYFEKHGDYTLQRFVYVKTSSFPLIPEMTQGLKLDATRKNIERFEKENNSNVRVVYRSGIKVGATMENIDVEELYNDNYDSIKDKIGSSTITLKRENFSIQQDKPFKTDKNIEKGVEDSINRGTQIDKILMGNGINKIETKIFPNMFDSELLKELGIEEGDMVSGRDLYAIYNYLSIKEQQSFRRQIFEDLGIDENSNWFDSIDTLEKIQDILDNRLSNYQDSEIIRLKYKVIENGIYTYYTKEEIIEKKLKPIGAEFDVPIWISPNSQKFESVLNSIVNNKTVKLKLPGSSSPVGSQEGFIQKRGEDTLTEKEKTGIVYTSSYNPEKGLTATLKEDGKIKSAQVLLPCKLRTKVKDSKGKLVDKLIDITKYAKIVDGKTIIDPEKIDSEVLTMFSFRIPTSSHQSGSIIEVVGFLPHEMGDTMIVPKDHVTQIGEDFDIDVRYYYRQNYITDETGKIRKLKTSDIPETTKERGAKVYEEYRNAVEEVKQASKNNIKAWVKDKKSMYELLFAQVELEALQESKVENSKIDDDSSMENELLDKITNLKQLVTPNNTETRAYYEVELGNQLADLKKDIDAKNMEIFRTYVGIKAVDAMKQKVIENNLISLYKSIYSSPSNEVQKKINATLSTDFAKDTANLIENTIKGKVTNKNFSVFDDRTQKEALRLGASGKLGIGVHSNWVVFNSLLQQQKDSVRIIEGVDKEGNKEYLDMTIGNLKSEGYLGQPSTLDGERSIATVNMENQNCSTDNQKLQVMGKRNENKFTINVFGLLCNLGFDKGTLNDGSKVHIPSLFISQPILRRYVELKEEYASIFSDFSSNAEEEITQKLKEEFGDGVDFYVNDGTQTSKMTNDAYADASKELTAQNLVNNLKVTNNSQQWAVYQKFLQLQGIGTNVNKVMQLLNIEKDGLGISFFNTIDKKDALLFDMFSESLGIENSSKLFGERRIIDDSIDAGEAEKLLESGYIHVYTGEQYSYYMKPTTSQNAKLINSLSLGFNLWNKIFPFEDKFITEQLNTITNISGIKEGTAKELEAKYKIISSMKDFIYAFNNPKLFGNSINEERRKLTIDSNNNESLANYLRSLKNQGHPLFEQPFFKDLEFDIFTDGEKPSIIRYSVSSGSSMNKNDAHQTIESLVGSSTQLPAYNGNGDYTFDDLAKDLTKYAMIADQENGAIGFRNYIPMAAFKAYGIDSTLKRVASTQNNHFNLLLNGELRAILHLSGSTSIDEEEMMFYDNIATRTPKEIAYISSLINNVNSVYGEGTIVWDKDNHRFMINSLDKSDFQSLFVEQYFQHNPEEAKKISWNKKKEILSNWDSANLDKLTRFVVANDDTIRDFLAIKKPKTSEYLLFKHIGSGIFERINTLGGFGMNEYSPLKRATESLYAKNNNSNKQPNQTLTINTVPKTKGFELKEGSTTKDVIRDILTNTTNEKYKPILNSLFQYGESNVKVEAKQGMLERGMEALYATKDSENYNEGTIYIDSSIASDMNSDRFQEAFIEEYLHSLTNKITSEWIGETGIRLEDGKLVVDVTFKKDGIRPYYVTKLVDLYKEGVKALVQSKGGNIEETITTINAMHDKFKGILSNQKIDTQNLDESAYRVFNIDEFIAGIFVSKDFRELMSKTEYKGSEKSLLEQFKDVVKRILSVLSNGTVKDSITEHTVEATFALLNKVNTISVMNENIWEKIAEDSIKKAEKLLKEPFQETTSEAKTSQIDFQEEQTSGYRNRTIKNASADATLALATDFNSAGEKLTKNSVLNQGKKYMAIDANSLVVTKERVDKIVEALNSVNAKTLNIAGNGIYTMKGKYTQQQIDSFTYNLLKEVLTSPNLRSEIESIRSGGQTGFDEAGAKAGIKLNLPTTILAPKNWVFRDINGKDIANEKQFKERFNQTNIQEEYKPEISATKPLSQNDIISTEGLFKPDFSRLLSEGRLQVQGIYLTLEEFNSMSEEEQEHFKKCL